MPLKGLVIRVRHWKEFNCISLEEWFDTLNLILVKYGSAIKQHTVLEQNEV